MRLAKCYATETHGVAVLAKDEAPAALPLALGEQHPLVPVEHALDPGALVRFLVIPALLRLHHQHVVVRLVVSLARLYEDLSPTQSILSFI